MSSEMNRNKTRIIVAVLGLIGVLGGALFANWDKVFPQNQSLAPKPTLENDKKSPHPSPSSSDVPTPATEINISGVWRDNKWDTTSEIAQQGSSFTFTASGPACIGGTFRSSGHGTIRGNSVESHYQSNFSLGDCSGTVSSDGRRMTLTCSDKVCGQFPSIAVKQ
jgi:hypothetical protein